MVRVDNAIARKGSRRGTQLGRQRSLLHDGASSRHVQRGVESVV